VSLRKKKRIRLSEEKGGELKDGSELAGSAEENESTHRGRSDPLNEKNFVHLYRFSGRQKGTTRERLEVVKRQQKGHLGLGNMDRVRKKE